MAARWPSSVQLILQWGGKCQVFQVDLCFADLDVRAQIYGFTKLGKIKLNQKAKHG